MLRRAGGRRVGEPGNLVEEIIVRAASQGHDEGIRRFAVEPQPALNHQHLDGAALSAAAIFRHGRTR
jgi:hypothetical protein